MKDKEKKQEIIQFLFSTLKRTLIENKMAIAFDKTHDKFYFIDREEYIKTKTLDGFKIPFDELTY